MYEIGRVYIWQNKKGLLAYLNGTETIVMPGVGKGYDPNTGEWLIGQKTDTPSPMDNKRIVLAAPGQLRPKNPPTGEQKIRSMFEPKAVMETA